MTPIKLLIVDDHPVFRQGLRDVFEAEADILVVDEALDGPQAERKAREMRPDVVLLDINLPGKSGIQVAHQIKELVPSVRVIMITGYDEPEQIFHSLRAGAVGFCSKDMPPEALIRSVRQVMDGKIIIQQQVMTPQEAENWVQKRADRFGQRSPVFDGDGAQPLTPREMEILEMICLGASNKDIARNLGISYQTVKNHVTAILHKLRVNDRTQAVLYAIRHQWFELE